MSKGNSLPQAHPQRCWSESLSSRRACGQAPTASTTSAPRRQRQSKRLLPWGHPGAGCDGCYGDVGEGKAHLAGDGGDVEVTRGMAVEIIGDEEEEEGVDEITKVVLIPKAQDEQKNFANIFADETIEPLEAKLRNIMDATRLMAEQGKVATDNFTLGIFRQRDVNDRPHTVYTVDTDEPAISDFLRAASFQFNGFDFTSATFESWLESINMVKFSSTSYSVRFGPFPFVMDEQKFARYIQACLQDLRGCDALHLLRQPVSRGGLRAGGQATTDAPRQAQPHRQGHVHRQPPPGPRHQADGHQLLHILPGDLRRRTSQGVRGQQAEDGGTGQAPKEADLQSGSPCKT